MHIAGSKKRTKRGRSILNVITRHEFTDRLVSKASTKAIRAASARAMALAGYVIKAEGDWVIRVEKDGSVTKVSKIESHPRPKILKLD